MSPEMTERLRSTAMLLHAPGGFHNRQHCLFHSNAEISDLLPPSKQAATAPALGKHKGKKGYSCALQFHPLLSSKRLPTGTADPAASLPQMENSSTQSLQRREPQSPAETSQCQPHTKMGGTMGGTISVRAPFLHPLWGQLC